MYVIILIKINQLTIKIVIAAYQLIQQVLWIVTVILIYQKKLPIILMLIMEVLIMVDLQHRRQIYYFHQFKQKKIDDVTTK